ncbi:MAG: hypothetical protein WA949_00315 [Phormidesmis sp.]
MQMSSMLIGLKAFKAITLQNMPSELPMIQKTYDLIKWYVPLLNRLPKAHKF